MLQFVKGPSGSGKTKTIYEQIIKRSSEFPQKTFILIVPEQNNLVALKELIELTKGKGILNIDVLSFNRLCHRIFDEAGGNNREILDDTSKVLIIRHLASLLYDKLNVFSGNLKKPGYINEIKSVISEFMQYDISLNVIQNMLGETKDNPVLFNKLSDIAIIYEEFKNYLSDRFITTEEILDKAIELSHNAAFLKSCEIYLDGFTGYTPVQVRFLGQMMNMCDRIVTTVTMGTDNDAELFSMGFKLINTLKKEAENASYPIEDDVILSKCFRFSGNSEIEFLENHLYRFDGKVFSEKCEKISIKEYSNINDEVSDITKDIVKRVREDGLRYRDIAILTGDIESYEMMFAHEFKKYNIPLFTDKTVVITLNPFIEFIQSAINCQIFDLNYESVVRFLRCGLGIFSNDEIDRIDNYLKAAGIKKRYKFERKWSYIPRYMKKHDENCILNELEELNECRKKILKYINCFSNTKQAAKEHAKNLYDFIVSASVYEKLSAYEKAFANDNDIMHEREYAQIYEKVIELLDKIVDFAGDEEVSLKEFADMLNAGLSSIRVGMIPPGVDEIMLGDMQRSRVGDIKALYLVGVNEGIIPGNSKKGGILSEDEREELLNNNFILSPTTKELIGQERFYMYMNLTKTSDYLTLSYPLVGNDGKGLQPSSLINEINKLYDNLFIDKYEASKDLDEVFSENEAIERLLLQICSKDKDYEELLTTYVNENNLEKIKDVLIKSQIKGSKRNISKEITTALYKDALTASITRLEKFAACPYSHFLKYGLRLTASEEYGFAKSDMGTIFHDVLQLYSEKLKNISNGWYALEKEESYKILEESINQIAQDNKESALFDNKRAEYSLKRMRRILRKAVDVLTIQIRHGLFTPSDFEIPFSVRVDDKLKLIGRIDRVDTYEDESGMYLKIIDYKSGNKKFSLAEIYHGLSLQLAVYLAATEEIYNTRYKNADLKKAALFYYHIDDPMIERDANDTAQSLEEKVIKALKMDGLVNSDEKIIELLDRGLEGSSLVVPVMIKKDGSISEGRSSVASDTEFEILSDYVNHKVRSLSKEILSGKADVTPYRFGKKSGCDFCDYSGICNFYPDKNHKYNDLLDIDKEEGFEKMEEKINEV